MGFSKVRRGLRAVIACDGASSRNAELASRSVVIMFLYYLVLSLFSSQGDVLFDVCFSPMFLLIHAKRPLVRRPLVSA